MGLDDWNDVKLVELSIELDDLFKLIDEYDFSELYQLHSTIDEEIKRRAENYKDEEIVGFEENIKMYMQKKKAEGKELKEKKERIYEIIEELYKTTRYDGVLEKDILKKGKEEGITDIVSVLSKMRMDGEVVTQFFDPRLLYLDIFPFRE